MDFTTARSLPFIETHSETRLAAVLANPMF